LYLQGDSTIETRYQIILKHKIIADLKLKEAHDIADYMAQKV